LERVYEYDKAAYRNKVLLVNIALVLILGYCLYKVIFGGTNVYLWLLAVAICVYALANSFLRKSNPRVITISDDEIVFASFGEKRFEIQKLIKFRVKVSTPNYQVLIRLEDSDKKFGSFWVTYSQFNDKLDLLAEFDYLEKKVHPDSLRFRGRSGMGNKRPEQNAALPGEENQPVEIDHRAEEKP
jgi:predicted membrane metal-binding protein